MRKISTVLFLLVLLGCESNLEQGLMEGMVAVDRAYIPVLAHTQADSPVDPAAAMDKLEKEWKYFQTRFYYYDRTDTSWQPSLNQIRETISAAAAMIANGEDKAVAHARLEEVRHTMSALRKARGLEYYLDGLLVFHGPMEQAVNLASSKTASTLTRADIRDLGAMMPRIAALWDSVSAIQLDTMLFGLDAAATSLVAEQLLMERSAIGAFQQALNSGSRNAIIVAAPVIKQEFAQLYQMFGDFPTSP